MILDHNALLEIFSFNERCRGRETAAPADKGSCPV